MFMDNEDIKNFVLEYWFKDFTFGYRNQKLISEKKTEHFHLSLFENETFGKVMMLDGATQFTTKEIHVYHEMIVHTPILAHGDVEEVLIIGGGDGGTAREVLRHKGVKVTMVEIDKDVVDFSIENVPEVSDGAFESDRLNLIIGDGVKYVKETDKKFDVIIIDSTDPVGPAKALFEFGFFNDCKQILKAKGIFVNQSGLPYLQPEELTKVSDSMSKIYSNPAFFLVAVPCYVIGQMAFAWGSDNLEAYNITLEELNKRYIESGIKTKYYNPEVHKAAFALPNEISKLIINK